MRVADLATLLNGLLGLGAIVFAAKGYPLFAAELVMAGIIVDGIDGALARIGLGGGPLGATLDTLADAVTFGVAPAVILLMSAPLHPILAVAAGLFLASVLLRLARFEALRTPSGAEPVHHFWGLSSPGGGLMLVTAILLDAPLAITATVALAAAALMLTRLPLPKLRGLLGVTAVLLIIAVLVGHGQTWQPITALVMLAFLTVYVIAGPLYVKARLPRPSPETH